MRSHGVCRGLGLAALVAIAIVVGVGVAGAQTTNDTTYPTVSTSSTTDPCVTTTSANCGTSATVPQVAGVSASRTLPFTGGNVALLTVLGVAAIGSGLAIVLFTRRRRSTSTV
jgi:LPXTG-motif cell wall-anchored protein